MGDFLNMVQNDPLLQQEKERLFNELKGVFDEFIRRTMRVLKQRLREKYPAFANDDSVIYHACVRVVRNIQKLGDMLNPSNDEERVLIAGAAHLHNALNKYQIRGNDLVAFIGDPPLISDSLAKASDALQVAIARAEQYSPEKKGRVRFYLALDGVVYNLDAKDKHFLESHAEILSVAFGVRINKYGGRGAWMQLRGIAYKNKK